MYWKCSAHGRCPAMVVQKHDNFTRGPSDHSHAATVGLHASVTLTADVLKRVRGDMFTSSSALIALAMTEVNVVSSAHDRRPNINQLVCLLSRFAKVIHLQQQLKPWFHVIIILYIFLYLSRRHRSPILFFLAARGSITK